MIALELSSLKTSAMIGNLIGNHLQPGNLVLLSGSLGSGKTTLTKSICAALGVNPNTVISPTYTMVNVYQGRWPIHHVDLYRLSSPDDLDSFDRDDLISEDGVTLVEWPELLQPLLETEPQLWIDLKPLTEASRMMQIDPRYAPFEDLIDALKDYEHSHD